MELNRTVARGPRINPVLGSIGVDRPTLKSVDALHERLHISTRQYARIARDWVTSIGLEASAYGTHSMRRTKVTQICKKTGNLCAVQLLLGHTNMDSTVRYLGVEMEDLLAISEAMEI